MMPTLEETREEREPGVYVRGRRSEHELDFLWDRDRKKDIEHDRFHLGFLAIGILLGSIITAAVCILFFMRDQIMPAIGLNKPAVVEQKVVQPADLAVERPAQPKQAGSQDEGGFSLPFFSSKPKAEEEPAEPAPEMKVRQYEVQSGDTLGSIAIKFYDSSSPEMIEKIQRANKMGNADQLSIGQKLVIPPKAY